MHLLAWSENLTEARAAEVGVRRVAKDELFASADFITVHLRLSPRTEGLVGARELALMRKDAYLVNTSRGPIVDEAALIQALDQGKIAGAALDVYDREPLPVDHPLRRAPNLLLTPHVGYVSRETYRVFYRRHGRPGRRLPRRPAAQRPDRRWRLNDQPAPAGRSPRRLGQLPAEIWRSGALQGLLIGAAGGTVFDALGLPAPWISGTMLAVAAAALADLRVGMPGWLRQLAFVVLGFTMGANITPATLAKIALWPASLVFLAGSIAATTIVLSGYLRLVHRWDPATAAFSAVPGAFTYLLLMAMRSRADVARVAVTQLIRLLVLTAVLPLLLSALDQGAGGAARPARPAAPDRPSC